MKLSHSTIMHSTCSLPSLSELSLNMPCQYKPSSSKLDIANLLSSPPPSPTSFEEHHCTDSKIKRKRASPDQLLILNRVFSQTYFPSTEVRKLLGKDLGMSPRTVQIWFQNKRQALRTRGRQSVQEQPLYYLPPISPPTSPTSEICFQHLHNQSKVSLPPLRLSCSPSVCSPSSCSSPSCNSSPISLGGSNLVDYFHHKHFHHNL
ncbi:hypothetical protein G6F56_002030 [Rhizopus delemar]|uniref:Homeobox domain-containing protein n=1 Tax=Rhizopus stolonifer TaxID=4846 RepID=A0A367KJP5_RHIST|nr:hypothetical protein G6F56_002030 [Rhizopus delemar]RCI02072.1 hypothetical protein CU098_008477 [Rhizopus stolonifer]